MDAGERTGEWSCDECGMDFAAHGPGDLASRTREFPIRWRYLTEDVDDATRRRRPDPSTWSAIEYGCHIDDALHWMVGALARTRDEDRPYNEYFDPDARAEQERYDERPYEDVSAALADGAVQLADLLEEVQPDEWERVARYSWGERDLLDMARNAVHEGVHHLWDVERVLTGLRED